MRVLVVFLLALVTPWSASAHGLLAGFVDEAVVSGLTVPVAFATLPDGRLLVVEKAGTVRMVRDGQVLPDAFLDLRDQVNDYWDRGLLGLAIDPAFAQNGYVYLFHVVEDDPLTAAGPKTSRVIRVTAAGDVAVHGSEVVLLSGIPADSASHNGGALAFGPDGALWITTGDAASFNAVDPLALRTQSLDSLAGKLLRVDRVGRGLADNPYWTGNAHDVRSKVWAYGFRNPFRLTFRPGSGRPYIADVGANDWEEIDAVVRGANHGWPCVEGPAPQAGYQALAECQALYAQGPGAVVAPVAAYPHLTGTASITGGAFYTGATFPEIYRGAYFFGDFSRGMLHYVAIDASHAVAGPIKGFGAGVDGVVDVQADADGLLYLSVTRGQIRRVRYVPDTGPRQTLYLSDITALASHATSGGGPIELDRSRGGLAAGDGGPLTLGATTFAKGLGVQAPSDIRFTLAGLCTSFTASAGIDDETRGAGSVTFELWLDGVRVVASGVVRGGTAPLSGTLDLTGVGELRLVVTDGGDGATNDHADWADARLECTQPGGDTLPPVVVTTTPAAGATVVATSSSVSALMSEDVAASSITAASLVVIDVATSSVVPGSVTYQAASRRIVFTPQVPLAAGTAYRATVAAGAVADAVGNVNPATTTWTFTTQALDTNQAPVPTLLTPNAGMLFAVGDVIAFSGTATDPEDGVIAPSRLEWTVSVRHCPGGICHTHLLTAVNGVSGSVVAPAHSADSYLVVTLTATDSDGRTASVSRDVRPRLVTVTLRTEPPGLPVIFGEARRLSPATFDAIVGSQINVATLTPQQSLAFTGWASGRPAQYVLTVGSSPVVDTARFVPAAGVSYLSDLAWTTAVNGAGPIERDRSAGREGSGSGGALSLRGVTYAKGLGMVANADVIYTVNRACSTFAATVGIDDNVAGGGSAFAGVVVDGRLAWVSDRLTGVSAPVTMTVDVTGGAEVRLVTMDAGDGSGNDHVDWADARLTCRGPGAAIPAAPVMTALASGQTAGVWWTPVPGAVTYTLEAGSSEGASDLASLVVATNHFSVAVPLGPYWLRVRAVNAWGTSAASPEARLVVDGTSGSPAAPGPLVAQISGGSVTLTWAPPASGVLPSEYLVEAGVSVGALSVVARTTTPELTVAGVPAGSYVVRVRAVTAAGSGPPGPAATVVVP